MKTATVSCRIGQIKITGNHLINQTTSMKEKLLKIQMEIGAIKKDSVNPHFKNRYFDINTLLEVVKPVLNKHGVVLMQGLTTIDSNTAVRLGIETVLIDTEAVSSRGLTLTGDMATQISFTCPLPDCADAQKYGSAITYFRRYALQSLLALEAEDDDGNTTVKPVAKVSGTNIDYPKTPNSDEIGF